jgi:putative molybdopterin biosynthesis protein
MTSRVENRLSSVRKSRAVSASDLARRVGVSRQTIYAIEAGTYVPNTEVALNLARELKVSVDELFALRPQSTGRLESVTTEVLSGTPHAKGQPVRLCQVESRWVSVPSMASQDYMPEADGMIQKAGSPNRRAEVVFFEEDSAGKRLTGERSVQQQLVLAGCDPATGLFARMVEKITGTELICAAASSRLAIAWLKQGKVHIAGSHLKDPESGEFNLPLLRKEFPGEDLTIVTFARWEAGLVLAAGNPKGLSSVEDLCRRDVTFINRESGSGSRALLDRLLTNAGITPEQVHGYNRFAQGHLAAAQNVVAGAADACLATRSAAQTFCLDFIPLQSERYDLVMRKRTADLPAVQALLDVLQRASLRRKLETLAGYDTSQTGALVDQAIAGAS